MLPVFAIIWFVVIAVALILAGLVATVMVAILAVLFGFGATLGFVVARKQVARGEGAARASHDSLKSWLGVSAMGIVAAGTIVAIPICIFLVTLSPRDHTTSTPVLVLLWIAPALGGSLAGLLHVILRKRPRRHMAAWCLAFGIPAYGVVAMVLWSARWLLEILPPLDPPG